MKQEKISNISFGSKYTLLKICSGSESSRKLHPTQKSKRLLFENFVCLVVRAVRPYSRYLCYTDVNDLFQEGCLGLLEAIIDFNSSRKEPFAKYADRYIYRRLKRFWRRQIDTGRFLPKLIAVETERLSSVFDSSAEEEEQCLAIREALAQLSPKQQLVIEQVCGFQEEPVSLSQIAIENKISHEAVRRTYKRGLMNLYQDPNLQDFAS